MACKRSRAASRRLRREYPARPHAARRRGAGRARRASACDLAARLHRYHAAAHLRQSRHRHVEYRDFARLDFLAGCAVERGALANPLATQRGSLVRRRAARARRRHRTRRVPQSACRAVPAGYGLGRGARRDHQPGRGGCLIRRPRMGEQARRHRSGLPRRGRRDAPHDQSVPWSPADPEFVALGCRGRLFAGRHHAAVAARQARDLAQHAELSCSAVPVSSAGRRPACSAVVFCLCIVPAALLSRGLDALSLGEDTAQSLGLSLPCCGSRCSGSCRSRPQPPSAKWESWVSSAWSRPISSARRSTSIIVSSSSRAPLCGGALLQAADLVSRWLIRPAELPVGAVTACVGGSYLVYLLWRRSRNA